MASVAEVVRAILLKEELVVFPGPDLSPQPGEDTTPCFVHKIPDSPDRMVALTLNNGRTFGRIQTNGKVVNHPGVTVVVREAIERELDGYDLAKRLYDFLTARLERQSVPIRERECFVASVYPIGDIRSDEEMGTRRQLFSFELRVAMEDTAELPVVE